MSYQNINREAVRSGFVRSLRLAFNSNTDYLYKDHPADPNQPADDSGIFIYDAWPWKKLNYPAIIVSLGPGDPMLRTIGGEHWSDTSVPFVSQDGLTHSNVTFETFSGGESNNVNINVYARSGVDRSQIMDWVNIYIRHFFVDAFQKEGVSIIGMSQGGENQELVGNDPVYSDSVTVNVYSEFKRDVSTELSGTIDAMSLVGVFTYLPNGSTDTRISS